MLLSDEEEDAYKLGPLLAERKDENSCLLRYRCSGCTFVNSVGAEEGAEKQC